MDSDQDTRDVRITADSRIATVVVDGHDIAEQVAAYNLHHQAGQPPELVLQLTPAAGVVFEGAARITIGEPPDPGPAAAAFLAGIDAAELEKAALARTDLLDGGPQELTRAMLAQLREWALGKWARLEEIN